MISPTPGPRRATAYLPTFLVALAVFLTAVLMAGLAVSPASAAPRHDNPNAGQELRYVALGDSYAYGVGADHTTQSYPAVLDAARPDTVLTQNLARPGATTSDVVSVQLPSGRDALKHADLVTLTVGGNDLDVAGLANVCSMAPLSDDCANAVITAQEMLTSGELARSLMRTLAAVRAAAPHAQILVTGYPLLFEPDFLMFGPLAQQLNVSTLALNSTIQAAVALTSHTSRGDLRFVSVVGPFLGHGIGSGDSWIHFADAASYHPTAAGYRYGYYPELARVVVCRDLLKGDAA